MFLAGREPLRQFILKLHGRCNLACDYCYVYESTDQRWRSRPASMSRRIIDLVVYRIAEHVSTDKPSAVDIVLHGGEPLLAGVEKIGYLLAKADHLIAAHTEIRFLVQTNGVLLDERYLELFGKWNVRIGVSLDGDRSANDRHRRTAGGTGSYPAVERALMRLGRSPLFAGLLTAVDVRNDPVGTYEALLRFRPPMVDFLLPHGNWSRPPPAWTGGPDHTPYADWLIAVFDRWYGAAVRETSVRLFDEIINVLLGGRSRVEGVGLEPPRMVVVHTDGGIDHSDVLSTAFEGASATGLNVEHDPFDAVTPPLLPVVEECRNCELYEVCGGGLPAHRYRSGNGFLNPSVYHADLYRLIGHIRQRVTADLAALGKAVP